MKFLTPKIIFAFLFAISLATAILVFRGNELDNYAEKLNRAGFNVKRTSKNVFEATKEETIEHYGYLVKVDSGIIPKNEKYPRGIMIKVFAAVWAETPEAQVKLDSNNDLKEQLLDDFYEPLRLAREIAPHAFEYETIRQIEAALKRHQANPISTAEPFINKYISLRLPASEKPELRIELIIDYTEI